MAKTIKITFYTPKELWKMFCNWVFWPRRKQCAEWLELMQVRLENKIITDLIIGKYYNQGILPDATCESLELDIKHIVKEECKAMAEIMSKPME